MKLCSKTLFFLLPCTVYLVIGRNDMFSCPSYSVISKTSQVGDYRVHLAASRPSVDVWLSLLFKNIVDLMVCFRGFKSI